MAIIKLSASRISSLLCYPVRTDPFLPDLVKNAIDKGRFIHLKFGYTNSQQFTRIIVLNNQTIQLTGIPDKIDYEKGIVEELKTYHSRPTMLKNIRVATIQLLVYEFITGLEKGKAVLFDINEGKITKEVPVNFNEELFKKLVLKAVELDQLQKTFVSQFNEIQKAVKGILEGGEK